jgi:DNA ligase (NAD+)
MNNKQYINIISKCPYCNSILKIIKNNNTEILICPNNQCNQKLINKLDHFCSNRGLDIKGLSKATLQKLINWGWVNSLKDIFKLNEHKKEWMNKPGFGEASVSKILDAINTASECNTAKYISALGIPLIGKVASEALVKTFKDYNGFRLAIESKDEELYQIAGIGEVMIETLLNYNYTEADEIFDKYIKEVAITSSLNDAVLEGKVFVITGKIKNWKNRDELKSFIESKGGKVTSSVTSKTSYLINNDTSSQTSKNLTAIKMHVPIINEEEFLTLVTPPNENIEPNYLASAT